MAEHPALPDLIREFRQHERRAGDSAYTITQRINRVRAVAADLAPIHVLELDTTALEDWLDDRPGSHGRGLARWSRRTYVNHLRAFYSWALKAGHVDKDPSTELVMQKMPESLPRPADDAVIAQAMDLADERMLAMLCLGAYEGLRCMEIAGVCREDISIPGMSIRVLGKGDKERFVPLHPETLTALRRHGLPLSGHVFTRQWRGAGHGEAPLTAKAISWMICKHLPPGTTAHQLRHWFGTFFYRESERDLLATAKVMGHASTRTTEGYAAADMSKAAAVVARLTVRRDDRGAWRDPDSEEDDLAN